MGIDILQFAEKEGRKICNAIIPKREEYPYLLGGAAKRDKGFLRDFKKGFLEAKERKKMEREIYNRSLHEATAFFLKNGAMKFDSKTTKLLRAHLSQRAKYPSELKKLTPEELLANEIRNYVTDFLLENDVFVFQNHV